MIAADLIAHWPLTQDAKELVNGLNTEERGKVQFGQVDGRSAAQFNGLDSYLQVKDDSKLALGTGDFSISMWVNPRRPIGGIPGDLINKWDSSKRRGMNLYLSPADVRPIRRSATLAMHISLSMMLTWVHNEITENLRHRTP